MNIKDKISQYVFLGLMVITAVILGMFLFVGYDNYETIAGKSLVSPKYTDLLLYWMYALVAAGVLCIVLFVIEQFFAKLKSNPKAAMNGVIGIALVVALFGGAYALADVTPIRMADNSLFEETSSLILADVCIYVQYVLLAVSVICTIVSLTGAFKAFNRIKA